jgi:hypothetical protein
MVRRLFLNDSNPEKMSKEEFKMRAAVLAKGTMALRCTLMIGDAFYKKVASNMVISSKYRGHSLTKKTVVRILKSDMYYVLCSSTKL